MARCASWPSTSTQRSTSWRGSGSLTKQADGVAWPFLGVRWLDTALESNFQSGVKPPHSQKGPSNSDQEFSNRNGPSLLDPHPQALDQTRPLVGDFFDLLRRRLARPAAPS